MPLIKPVEDLLKQISDEGARKRLQADFEQYDFLQRAVEGNLRQSDYDKLMNDVKEQRRQEQESVKGYEAQQKKWKEWADKNIPLHEQLKKNFTDLEIKNKELEEKLVAAAARTAEGEGTPVDEAALLQRVREEIVNKGGFVSEAQVKTITEGLAKTMVEEQAKKLKDGFYATDFPNALKFMTSLNDVQWLHREEFKSPLDNEKFAKFMHDEKIDDPRKAYERFVSEDRQKAAIEKIKADTRAEVERDIASKSNLPGSGVTSAPELGPVQMDRMKKTTYIPEDAKAGDNVLAYAAAAELRSEGKV